MRLRCFFHLRLGRLPLERNAACLLCPQPSRQSSMQGQRPLPTGLSFCRASSCLLQLYVAVRGNDRCREPLSPHGPKCLGLCGASCIWSDSSAIQLPPYLQGRYSRPNHVAGHLDYLGESAGALPSWISEALPPNRGQDRSRLWTSSRNHECLPNLFIFQKIRWDFRFIWIFAIIWNDPVAG